MKWWKVVIAVVILLAVGAITAGGLRDRPPPAVDVQTAKARKGTITRTIVGAGKLEATTTVNISSSLSGNLTELNVKAGDHVTKGEVLAKIDRRQYEAAVTRAKASVRAGEAQVQGAKVTLGQTTRELQREQALATKGLASQADVDKARAARDSAAATLASNQQQLAQADASLVEAQTDLSKTTIFAPMDGTIIGLNHQLGERVMGSDFTQDTVMTLASVDTMEVKLDVGENEVIWLKPGQKATITIDALPDQTFEGVVTEIAQQATIKNEGTEQETVSFPIKVALLHRPPGVLTGMSAEVRIAAETHEGAVLVPIQAVTVRSASKLAKKKVTEQKPMTSRTADSLAKVVFVVGKDGHVHARQVKTGIAAETDIEILDGLEPGDEVVSGPFRAVSRELHDGSRVRVSKGGFAGGFGAGSPRG